MCPPDDSGGIYSVPVGTIVNTGDTVLPSQHNPWANDSATAISNRFSKDGRAPATGNWNMNNFRIQNLPTPIGSNDAVPKTYADGLSTALIASLALQAKGYLYGLTLSNNAVDATNDIDIALGAAGSDSATSTVMTLAAGITKRLDAAWAVGSGNGGLDTGSIANTTYHVWLIQRSDTGVVDALFSASATSPTMPANYDRKRRIGSVIRSGGTLLAFNQDGDVFTHKTPIQDVNATNPGTAAVTRVVSVPAGIRVEAFGSVLLSDNVATPNSFAYLSDLANTDSAPSLTFYQVALQTSAPVGINRNSGFWRVFTNTSSSIRSRLSASAAGTGLAVTTFGWVDLRGRT